MSKFAQMFNYLRKRDGLTQKELARRLGLAESTISMYEFGKREATNYSPLIPLAGLILN